MLAFAKITAKGQTTIPQDVRAALNVVPGDLIAWEVGADGTATVQYRGAAWTAIHRPGVNPSTGRHRVAVLVGNRLLVDPL